MALIEHFNPDSDRIVTNHPFVRDVPISGAVRDVIVDYANVDDAISTAFSEADTEQSRKLVKLTGTHEVDAPQVMRSDVGLVGDAGQGFNQTAIKPNGNYPGLQNRAAASGGSEGTTRNFVGHFRLNAANNTSTPVMDLDRQFTSAFAFMHVSPGGSNADRQGIRMQDSDAVSFFKVNLMEYPTTDETSLSSVLWEIQASCTDLSWFGCQAETDPGNMGLCQYDGSGLNWYGQQWERVWATINGPFNNIHGASAGQAKVVIGPKGVDTVINGLRAADFLQFFHPFIVVAGVEASNWTATGGVDFTGGQLKPTAPSWAFGTAVWNPASIADGDALTTTVTVTGAALGDPVIVTGSINLQSLQLTGSVTASNTVTVVLSNSTGAAVDLPSMTVTAAVMTDQGDSRGPKPDDPNTFNVVAEDEVLFGVLLTAPDGGGTATKVAAFGPGGTGQLRGILGVGDITLSDINNTTVSLNDHAKVGHFLAAKARSGETELSVEQDGMYGTFRAWPNLLTNGTFRDASGAFSTTGWSVTDAALSERAPWHSSQAVPHSGTFTSSGTAVTGSGTTFTNLTVGQYLYSPSNDEFRKITAIGSATGLTLASGFTANVASAEVVAVAEPWCLVDPTTASYSIRQSGIAPGKLRAGKRFALITRVWGNTAIDVVTNGHAHDGATGARKQLMSLNPSNAPIKYPDGSVIAACVFDYGVSSLNRFSIGHASLGASVSADDALRIYWAFLIPLDD